MKLYKNYNKWIVGMLIFILTIPVITPLYSSLEMPPQSTKTTFIFKNNPAYIKDKEGNSIFCYDLHIEYDRVVDYIHKDWIKVKRPPDFEPHHETTVDILANKLTIKGEFPPETEVNVTVQSNTSKQIIVISYYWTDHEGKKVGPNIKIQFYNFYVTKMDFTYPQKESDWKTINKPIAFVTAYLNSVIPKDNVKSWELIKKVDPKDPSKTKIKFKVILKNPQTTKVQFAVDPPDEVIEMVLDIQIDEVAPTIQIQKPRDGIYMGNSVLLSIPNIAIVFGSVDIEVNASDDNLMDEVKIYIDEELKSNDTEAPYTWVWSEFSIGKHSIKAIAFDNATNNATDEIIVWKFF